MKYVIIFSIFLTGCVCNPVLESKTVEVKVPVPVPCKIQPVDKPQSLLGTLKKEDDIHTKTKVILAEIEAKKAYEAQLEAAIKECQ